MELVSANSHLFSTTELRLSTILRECSAIINALSEYDFFIQDSQHHKPNHRLNKFQLVLVKFPNLNIVWTEGKNFSLPDLLSRSLVTTTQDERLLRIVEIPDFIIYFMTHNQNTKLYSVTTLYRKNILTH